MSETVYRFARANSTEAWYQLSKDKQDKLTAKMNENMEQLGGKITIMCDCAWSTEEWQSWIVTEFPNIKALQKHTAFLMELDWYRYCEVESMLGSEFRGSET